MSQLVSTGCALVKLLSAPTIQNRFAVEIILVIVINISSNNNSSTHSKNDNNIVCVNEVSATSLKFNDVIIPSHFRTTKGTADPCGRQWVSRCFG